MSGWAVMLSKDKALTAGELRAWPGIVVHENGDALWLKGESLTPALERELRKLPGAQRFTFTIEGELIPVGARIPRGTLPAGDWLPIASWLTPAPQPAALAGAARERVALRLVRCEREIPASALVTSAANWIEYACSAPLVRLRPLRFAVSEDGRAVVRGVPLPPIPGQRYVEREGIATPSGFQIAPALDAATLRAVIGTTPADLALFHEDRSCERISAAAFVAASRSSARATAASLRMTLPPNHQSSISNHQF